MEDIHPKTPWFFHDFAFDLDDPNAPLPSSAFQKPVAAKPDITLEDEESQHEEANEPVDTGSKKEERFSRTMKRVISEQRDATGSPSPAPGVGRNAVFTTTSYVGSLSPNIAWLAFNPSDCKQLEQSYNSVSKSRMNSSSEKVTNDDENIEDEANDELVLVGANRLYYVNINKMFMSPMYWDSIKHYAHTYRATWFHSTTLTPVEPSLEAAVAKAYAQIRPWTPEYVTELETAINVPEALDRIKVPITYRQYFEDPTKPPVVHKVVVVFPPCCRKEDLQEANRLIQAMDAEKETKDVKESEDANESDEKSTSEESKDDKEKPMAKDPEPAHTVTPKQSLEKLDIADSSANTRSPSGTKIAVCSPTDFPVAFILSEGAASTSSKFPLLPTGLTPTQLLSSLLLGKPPSGTQMKIQRHFDWDSWKKTKGLPDRETDAEDFEPPKINQLVLVIHGIGQKLSDRMESFNFTHAINGFRASVIDQTKKPGVSHLVKDSGILALPVNWRQKLDFEELRRQEGSASSGNEDYRLQDITMKSIPAVRNMISDVLMDIPFYLSHHRPMLIDATTKEANRVYDLFVKYNPDFLQNGGKVNIIGHSLGSVLAMDILSSQPTDVNNLGPGEQKMLNFNTSNLFLVGSPVAFFLLLENSRLYPRQLYDQQKKDQSQSLRRSKLSMKNVNPDKYSQEEAKEAYDSSPSRPGFARRNSFVGHDDSKPPYGCMAIDNVYNILHYSDPISYLLNPTVDAQLATTLEPANLPAEKAFPDPVTSDSGWSFGSLTSKIPFWSDSSSNHARSDSNSSIKSQSQNEKDKDTDKEADKDADKDKHSESGSQTPSETKARIKALPSEVELETRNFGREQDSEKKMLMLNDNGQIDWIIPLTGTLENQYVSMLTAHSSYWDNKDFARMVAIECGRERGKDHIAGQYAAKKKS
uniref:ARAD1A12078p n=1 Tax=Blastobotrys adeninivorans TaxID=409370 RepID=A0A060SYG1_BLAAD